MVWSSESHSRPTAENSPPRPNSQHPDTAEQKTYYQPPLFDTYGNPSDQTDQLNTAEDPYSALLPDRSIKYTQKPLLLVTGDELREQKFEDRKTLQREQQKLAIDAILDGKGSVVDPIAVAAALATETQVKPPTNWQINISEIAKLVTLIAGCETSEELLTRLYELTGQDYQKLIEQMNAERIIPPASLVRAKMFAEIPRISAGDIESGLREVMNELIEDNDTITEVLFADDQSILLDELIGEVGRHAAHYPRTHIDRILCELGLAGKMREPVAYPSISMGLSFVNRNDRKPGRKTVKKEKPTPDYSKQGFHMPSRPIFCSEIIDPEDDTTVHLLLEEAVVLGKDSNSNPEDYCLNPNSVALRMLAACIANISDHPNADHIHIKTLFVDGENPSLKIFNLAKGVRDGEVNLLELFKRTTCTVYIGSEDENVSPSLHVFTGVELAQNLIEIFRALEKFSGIIGRDGGSRNLFDEVTGWMPLVKLHRE